MPIDNDLEKLIKNLPIFIQEELKQFNIKDQLIEIILDAGRQPEAGQRGKRFERKKCEKQ